jgi:hypothetical protein
MNTNIKVITTRHFFLFLFLLVTEYFVLNIIIFFGSLSLDKPITIAFHFVI